MDYVTTIKYSLSKTEEHYKHSVNSKRKEDNLKISKQNKRKNKQLRKFQTSSSHILQYKQEKKLLQNFCYLQDLQSHFIMINFIIPQTKNLMVMNVFLTSISLN